MKILAFETSVGHCSVSLSKGEIEAYAMSENQLMQSEELITMANKIMDEHKISYGDLDAIACSLGPGSFTGIRVGIAAARGMKHVLQNTKLIGVSTLELILYGTPENILKNAKKILCIIKAYGDEFYAQEFSEDKNPLSEIYLISSDQLHANKDEYQAILSNEKHDSVTHVTDITALTLLHRAKQLFPATPDDNSIDPLYIKQPNIHKKS